MKPDKIVNAWTAGSRPADARIQCAPEAAGEQAIVVWVAPGKGHERFSLRLLGAVVATEDSALVQATRQTSLPSLAPDLRRAPPLFRQASDIVAASSSQDGPVVPARNANLSKAEIVGDEEHGYRITVRPPSRFEPIIRGYVSARFACRPHCQLILEIQRSGAEEDNYQVEFPLDPDLPHVSFVLLNRADDSSDLLESLWHSNILGAISSDDSMWPFVWNCASLLRCGTENNLRNPIIEIQALYKAANALLLSGIQMDSSQFARLGLTFAACAGLVLESIKDAYSFQNKVKLDLKCLNVDETTLKTAYGTLKRGSNASSLSWKHLGRLVRDGLEALLSLDAATFPVASFESVRCGIWLEALYKVVPDKGLGLLKRPATGGSEQALRTKLNRLDELRNRLTSRLSDTFLDHAVIIDTSRQVEIERAQALESLDRCRGILEYLGIESNELEKHLLSTSDLIASREQVLGVTGRLSGIRTIYQKFFQDWMGRLIVAGPSDLEGAEPKTEAPPYRAKMVGKRNSAHGRQALDGHSRVQVCTLRSKSSPSRMFVLYWGNNSKRHLVVHSPEHEAEKVVTLDDIQGLDTTFTGSVEIAAICNSPVDDTTALLCIRSSPSATQTNAGQGNQNAPFMFMVLRISLADFVDFEMKCATILVEHRFSALPDIGLIGEFSSGAVLVCARSEPIVVIMRRTRRQIVDLRPPTRTEQIRKGDDIVFAQKLKGQDPKRSSKDQITLLGPISCLSHEQWSDRIAFCIGRRDDICYVYDIDDTGDVRALTSIRSDNVLTRGRISCIIAPHNENDPLWLFMADSNPACIVECIRIRDREYSATNKRTVLDETLPLPQFVSFATDSYFGVHVGLDGLDYRKTQSISNGLVETRAIERWKSEAGEWLLSVQSFSSYVQKVLSEIMLAYEAIFRVERRAIADTIFQRTSAAFWQACDSLPHDSLQVYMPIVLHAAPSLADVAKLYAILHSNIDHRRYGSNEFYHSLERALNVWIDLYEWPSLLLEKDVESLISLVRVGENSIVTQVTLSRVFDSRNFFASLTTGLQLLHICLEMSDFDISDVFRLPCVHWLARIDLESTLPRPLPMFAVFRKMIAYWDGVFAATTDPELQPTLEWLFMSHLRTLSARRSSTFRALAYVDSANSSSTRPRGLLAEMPGRIFRDVLQSSSQFISAVRAVTLEASGGLITTLWKTEPSLEFYSKGDLPKPETSFVRAQLKEPTFESSYFLIDASADSSNPESLLMLSSGGFEAAASGVFIFVLASPGPITGTPGKFGGMWLTIGKQKLPYSKLNQPCTIELSEGDHTIEIRAFSLLPGVRLVIEGPYTAITAKHRLEKPLSAKKVPYPSAGSLFGSREHGMTNARHTADSVSTKVAWALIKSVLEDRSRAATLTQSKSNNNKRKQNEHNKHNLEDESDSDVETGNVQASYTLLDGSIARSTRKFQADFLGFGIHTAVLLLRYYDIHDSVPNSFGQFLTRLRTNLKVFWKELIEDGLLGLTALEAAMEAKSDLALLPGMHDAGLKLQNVMARMLAQIKHLERVSSVLTKLNDISSESTERKIPDSTFDALNDIEAILRSYKRTRLMDITEFIDTRLAEALRMESSILPFVEHVSSSPFFQPLWTASTVSTLEASDENSTLAGQHLSIAMNNFHKQWNQLRTLFLSGEITWRQLQYDLHLDRYSEHMDLEKELQGFFQVPVDSASKAIKLARYWTTVCLVANNWQRAIQCLSYLDALVKSESSDEPCPEQSERELILQSLQSSGERYDQMGHDGRMCIKLFEIETEEPLANILSPPILLRLETAFCQTLGQSMPLFIWLRKLRNDSEFASSVEMAFTKPEWQVPQELWNHEKGCLDETVLSVLSDIRSTFHPVIYDVEDLPVSRLNLLFVVLQRAISQASYSQGELCKRLIELNTKRKALMQLLAGDELSGTAAQNQLLFLQSREACWVLEIGHEVAMEYSVVAEEGGLIDKRLDRESLADLQSTLVLGAAQDDQDELVASLAADFVEEITLMDTLNHLCARLSQLGHLSFYDSFMSIPFSGQSSFLRNACDSLVQIATNWEQTVADFRSAYPLLSCFSNRQVVELTRLLLSCSNISLPSASELLGFQPRAKSVHSTRLVTDMDAEASGAELLGSRDPDDTAVGSYSVVWRTCQQAFQREVYEHTSNGVPVAADILRLVGRCVTREFERRSISARYVSVGFYQNISLLFGSSGGTSSVKIVRAASRQRMVDVALSAYAALSRFPSRNDCLFCSEFTTVDVVLNLVSRWELESDQGALYCLISADSLSFDDQQVVGKALSGASLRSKCRLLIVLASRQGGIAEESVLEGMFGTTGRIALTPLPSAQLRKYISIALGNRGIQAECYSSKLPGQGKSHAIRKRASGMALHTFRLNALLSLKTLAHLAKTDKRAIHIDISDSAARSQGVGAILFNFIVLNGVVDDSGGNSFSWRSSQNFPFHLFVELPSGAPLSELRLCQLLEPRIISSNATNFDVDWADLELGMGLHDFQSSRFDGILSTI